jgi:hypothetical protein
MGRSEALYDRIGDGYDLTRRAEVQVDATVELVLDGVETHHGYLWVEWGPDPAPWSGGKHFGSSTLGQRTTLLPHSNWDRLPPIPARP